MFKKSLSIGLLLLVFASRAMAQEFDLVTDSVTMYWPAGPLEKPAYLENVTDPDFGTTITRVTGDPGSTIPVIGGTWKNIARHGYSKIPVWNADESILYLETQKGGPAPLFLDGDTYEVLFTKKLACNEKRWHPKIPELMIALRDTAMISWNVFTGEIKKLADISGYKGCQMGPWEGNLSFDGNRVAVYATRISDNAKTGFVIDMVNGTKFPDVELTDIHVDWISVSATGNYLVVQGTISGGDDQTQIYDVEGNKVGALWSEYSRPGHYDLTVDENGDEVAVGVSKSSPDNGRVIKRRLKDGMVTVLTKGGYATHTSTRCYGRPGWAISSYSHRGPANWEPYYNEIVAVKLDGTRAERICHIRGLYQTYDNEAQPCPSPSGSRIIFASDWDSGSEPIQAYVADFRDRVILGSRNRKPHETSPGIYPNPASDFIIIPDMYRESTYRILSITGSIVQTGMAISGPMGIRNLSNGFYIIELTDSRGERQTFRFVKN